MEVGCDYGGWKLGKFVVWVLRRGVNGEELGDGGGLITVGGS